MKSLFRRLSGVLLPALLLGVFCGVQTANAAGFLWISAPTWSYSAAAAASPAGSVYFWGLSLGVSSYSYAYAFSNDGLGDAAYAFARAAAGRGGVGGVNVSGLADPWAGVAIDSILLDPSSPLGFPSSDPNSDPTSSGWSVNGDNSGITFGSESSSELNGIAGLEAFYYTGGTDLPSLESLIGASSQNGTSSAGDVSDIGSLLTLSPTLIPLDDLVLDPSGSGLSFTNSLPGGFNPADVILVAEGEAASTPEPAAIFLLGGGLAGLFVFRRRLTA